MLQHAEQQLATIKKLLCASTPQSFEAACEQLTVLQSTLQGFVSAAPPSELAHPHSVSFLQRLPSELAHMQRLLQTPVRMLEGLLNLRIQKFGSYNHQGEVNSLEPAARTITHL